MQPAKSPRTGLCVRRLDVEHVTVKQYEPFASRNKALVMRGKDRSRTDP